MERLENKLIEYFLSIIDFEFKLDTINLLLKDNWLIIFSSLSFGVTKGNLSISPGQKVLLQ